MKIRRLLKEYARNRLEEEKRLPKRVLLVKGIWGYIYITIMFVALIAMFVTWDWIYSVVLWVMYGIHFMIGRLLKRWWPIERK